MSMSGKETPEVEPLRVEDFGGNADERRREPRFGTAKWIAIRSCRPGDERGFRRARLLDCSVHGLGLFADEPMNAGEQFLVQFDLGGPMLAVYTVRYCRPVADRHLVGAALDGFIGGAEQPDADAVLRALLDAGRPPNSG